MYMEQVDRRYSDTRLAHADAARDYDERADFARQQIKEGVYDITITPTLEKILAPNVLFEPGGDFYEPLMQEVSEPTNNQDHLFDLATDIGNRILADNKTPRAIAVSYLNTCYHLDRLRVGARGIDDKTGSTSFIFAFMRLPIAEHLGKHETAQNNLKYLPKILHEANHKNDFFGWFIPKLAQVMQQIDLQHEIRHTAESAYADTPTQENPMNNTEDLKQQAQGFLQDTVQKRKYGVKPAYMPASFGGSWVFYDGDTYGDMLYGTEGQEHDLGVAAVIVHTAKEDLKDLQIKKEYLTFGSGVTPIVSGAFREMRPDMQLILGDDGKLYTDLARFFLVEDVLSGSPHVYTSLLSEIASGFHDLTVPVATLESHGIKGPRRLSTEERKNYDPILELLIPRIKASLVRQEQESDDEDTDIVRTVREHNVTWFVRRLPSGAQSSPEARARAARHSIHLAENETFVKAHKRGSGHQVLGHRAIKSEVEYTTY